MGLVDHLDFWLAIITLGALAYYVLGDLIRPIVRPIASLLAAAGRLAPAPTVPPAERDPQPDEDISPGVSGTTTPQTDDEMIAIRALVKLVDAGLVTETAALTTVFGVKAGSSKRYKEVQAKLKVAQAELGEREIAR